MKSSLPHQTRPFSINEWQPRLTERAEGKTIHNIYHGLSVLEGCPACNGWWMVYARQAMNWENPKDEAMRQLLAEAKTIAVVGCSPNPERTSHQIAGFLLEQGYRMIPVHPAAKEVHGQKAYASLLDIPKSVHVDIVDVFRKPEATPPIAEQAVAIGAKALWLQQGIISKEAYRIASEGGLTCVMDRCIAVMHRLLLHD